MTPVFSATVEESVTGVGADDWDALFPGRAEESWAYLSAVERAGLPGFVWRAATVRRDGRLVAVAPLFRTDYRLDTTLQGAAKSMAGMLTRLWPDALTLRLVCLGTPVNDTCPLGFAPALTTDDRAHALTALLDAVAAFAAKEGCGLLAAKDVDVGEHGALDPVFRAAGFSVLPGLPNAVLRLPDGGENDYLASLSGATRKNVRRKLKSRAAVTVEYRESLNGVLNTVMALYESTRANSGVDYDQFETLTPDYFQGVVDGMAGRAGVYLYWHGETLLGFNLLLQADGGEGGG